jgi:SAM-dependent methyltransferase
LASLIAGKFMQALKNNGGVGSALRRYGLIQLSDAVLREGWEAIGMRVLSMLGRRPENGYGWLEALLSPTCDYWYRYAQVIAALNEFSSPRKARLVEVATGGGGGIAWALGRQELGVCLVDRSAELLRDTRGRGTLRICADACTLPFQDNSFDVALSVDTIEHLPRGLRPAFVSELKRVGKHGVVITCPMESADDRFQARRSDLRLSQIITKRNRVQPGWLREHLEQGHPTRDELLELLPGAQVTGSENCDVWLRFASLHERSFMWLFSALFYVLVLRRQDTKPPYRRGLLLWRKQAMDHTGANPARASETFQPEGEPLGTVL